MPRKRYTNAQIAMAQKASYFTHAPKQVVVAFQRVRAPLHPSERCGCGWVKGRPAVASSRSGGAPPRCSGRGDSREPMCRFAVLPTRL